jgi:hypothetical protein
MDKSIKVTASIDEVSFSKAKTKLVELATEMKKLVDLSKEVNLGGILGVGGGKSMPGTGKGAPTGKGGGAGPSVAVGGVDALSKAAAGFKTMGETAKASLKGMADAVKESFGNSSKEADKLLRDLAKVERGFQSLQKKTGSVSDFTQAERESIMPGWRRQLSVMNRIGGAASDLTPAEHAAIQGPMGRFMSRFGGMANSPIPFTPKMPGAPGSVLGRVMGSMGFGAGSMGLGIAGGVAAVGAAANFALNQRYNQQVTALDYQANHLPFIGAQRAATMGQIFGGNAVAIRQGDLARTGALRGLAGDKNFLSLVGDQRMELQKFMVDKKNSTSFWQNPTFGNAKEQFSNWVGGKTSKLVDFMAGAEIPGLTTQQANEIRNTMQKDFVASRGAEDLQKMLDLKLQQDPVANALRNQLGAGAQGDIAMSRAAGISGGLGWRKNPRTGQLEKYDTVKGFNAQAANTLYGGGEIASQMMQTLAASGSRGGVGTAASLMNATYGGLANATALYGTGRQFGAGGFYGGFQGMLGGAAGVGGVAGSMLGNAVIGGMTSGNFAGFVGSGVGLGFAQTLADATFTGNASTDMLSARQVQGGLGALGNRMSGGIDPLQQALNMSASLKAAPGGNYGVHRGLMTMDPASMMEVLRTGKETDWMRSRGISVDMVKRYSEAQNSTVLSRYATQMGMGSAMGAAADRYRKAGGLGYMKGWDAKRRNAEISSLGEILVDSTGISRDDARGLLRIQAGMSGILPKAKGRGVGAGIDRGSTRAHYLKTEGQFEDIEGKKLVDMDEDLHGDIASRTRQYGGQENARRIAQASAGGTAEEAIAGVQVALQSFVNALKGLTPQKSVARAGAPRP